MALFRSKSLRTRLALTFTLAAVLPAACLALLVVVQTSRQLARDGFERLENLRQFKAQRVGDFLDRQFRNLSLLAKIQEVEGLVGELHEYHDQANADGGTDFPVDRAEYRRILEGGVRRLGPYIEELAPEEMFLVCAPHGHVMFSLGQSRILGKRLDSPELREAPLAALWRRTLETGQPQMSDLFRHPLTGEDPLLFLSSPVRDEGGVGALLFLQVSGEMLDRLLQDTGHEFGETGETYLVGDDSLMRTQSRLGAGRTVLEQRVDTEPLRRAREGLAGTASALDYRGHRVLSSYADMGLARRFGSPFDWYILAEVDRAEAFALVRRLSWFTVAFATGFSLLGALAGMGVAHGIGEPIQRLATAANEVAAGNLAATVAPYGREDAIGTLTNAFATMARNLREQNGQMQESIQSLGAAIGEIAATSTQLAANSTEASAAVAEVGTTVEEVRQTSQVAERKAGEVAGEADNLARTAAGGRAATEDAVAGMGRIKEEMDYVAESIVQLSEQTQSIGDIIGAVNDLADQSNLLSVNAAIEAAKAGEYGKGFAVVAREIRSLSDQSREATRQVKTILDDIRKATSAAVMATERATKSVEAGGKLAAQAGHSIHELAEGVDETAAAAVQIAAANQQQVVGMDQLATAMQSIQEAANQNLAGARQLDEATRTLDQLGRDLAEMADRFRA